MNCSTVVKNIQVVPNTFSIFLEIDAFDTIFNRKILSNGGN